MDDQHYASVFVGFSDEAASGLDRLDQFAPPPHFSTFGLVIEGTDKDFDGAPLARDMRPSGQAHFTIPLTLYAVEGALVRFNVKGITGLPFQHAKLVNTLDTQTYDLHGRASFSMIAEVRQTPFLLVMGDSMSVDEKINALKPQGARLKQNYPNPFSTETTIEYTVDEAQDIALRVIDILGRHVVTLFQGYQEPGLHRVVWDGYDQTRARVASGLYLYQFQVGRTIQSKKLVVH